jgi:hypothetical protein
MRKALQLAAALHAVVGLVAANLHDATHHINSFR